MKSNKFLILIKYIVSINIVIMNLGYATNYYFKSYHLDYVAFFMMIFSVLCISLSFKKYRKKLVNKVPLYIFFLYMWLLIGAMSTSINSDSWYIRQPIYFSSIIAIITGVSIYITCENIDIFKFYCKSYLIATSLNYLISYNELINGIHITEPKGGFQLVTTYVGLSNQNNYATLLLYSTIIAYLLFTLRKKKSLKNILLFSLIFIIDSMLSFITDSTTGILGHLIIVIIILLRKLLNFNTNSIKNILNVIYGLYGVFVLTILCGIIPNINDRISYLNNVRVEFIPYAFIGLGAGGSNLVNNGWVHNLMFEILYDYGLIIFIILFILLYKISKYYSYIGYYEISFVVTLLPIIWISSSSALSLHFTWSFLSLIMMYPIMCIEGERKYVFNGVYSNF